jgi:cellulose synthase/poly-beta-1,6-N-acetylglucosamine synthase-like glycosyltransferase
MCYLIIRHGEVPSGGWRSLVWLSTISPVALGLTALYGVFLLWILWGLFRVQKGQNQRRYSVSVVVAAKNEERSIETCLRALLIQDYAPECYEVVVVDDGSVDATPIIAHSFVRENSQVKLVRAGGGGGPLRGKKRAIQIGIENSSGEIILITDADCRPESTWISAMVRHFTPSVGLVAGQVYQDGRSIWQKLRSLERLSVSAVAAGAISWGQGLTATGGNLGYRRRVFQELDGFKTISKPLSGDDDLFIQRVSRRTSWQLRYAFEPEASVTTDPPSNLGQFVTQERRRTSKGKYYPPLLQAFLAEAFLMNLALAASLPFSLAHPVAYPLPLIAFGGKVICELLILIKASHLFKREKLLRFFPLAAVLHIPYFLIFAIWGTLGGYRWKTETPPV